MFACKQNSPCLAEQCHSSAGQDQETADHWGCACVAKISAATIYFAVGIGSCIFGLLTRFQDCCLCVVAFSLSNATTTIKLERVSDTFEFSVYLATPSNTEEKHNSRSKTNFSFQSIAIYVSYTQFNGIVKNTTAHVVRCAFHNILINMFTVKKNPRSSRLENYP